MKKPNMSAAVRQQKAPRIVEGDTPEQALYRMLNFFPTPPWGARAGAEILKELDPKAQIIWESACGEGHMAQPLREYFPIVLASDIHDHGYGAIGDFLLMEGPPGPVDWVVTNPPFSHAAAFLRQGLRFADRGVALLLRIAFLEGAERFPLLYQGEYPMTVCAPFVDRISMVLGQFDPDARTPGCLAWFFFSKISAGAAPPIIRPIPPGTEARLTHPDDARRFAKLAPAPLFD